MKHILSALLLFTCVFQSSATEPSPASDRIMVLISLDGLAHFYLDDPKADMPMIRQLIAEGARAEKMKAVIPTVTWPNHVSIVTGVMPAKHGVVGNIYFDRATGYAVGLAGDPVFNMEEIVKVPTIFDVAKKAGLKTAGVAWPATRGAKSLDWTVPFVQKQELFEKYGTLSLWAEFKKAGIPYETEADGFKAGKGKARDEMNVQMFNLIVHEHRPNFVLLHILDIDHTEHGYGPQTPEAYEAIKFADGCVRKVWEQLNKDFPGKATIVIVSDHGFLPYWQTIQPNVLLRKEGLLKSDEWGQITEAKVRAQSEGGTTFLYVLDKEHREELIERVAKLFANVEGVEPPITPKDFKKYGLADPQSDPHMPDLILSTGRGYSFSDVPTGDVVVTPKSETVHGTHGYDPNNEAMYASFVAWGAGIKHGVKIGPMKNIDVAPTIAEIMGLKMHDLDGKVLRDILSQ